MKTKITELLNIEKPVIQGGMAWVATWELAAAVSNAGGLGLIGTASADGEWAREQIRLTRKHTDKPFGVNIMLMNPHADEIARVCIEEKVAVITTGAGNPGKYIPQWKEAEIKVIPVVPSVALAKRMERAGADAVVAEGTEAGGHIGELTTMCLVPQIVDALTIPVIAAGGIADERGFAAALMLGAQGVQIGTILLAADETPIHQQYKDLVVEAKDTDTTVTGRSNGHPVRCLRNRFSKKLLELEKESKFEEIEQITIGSYRKAIVDGDLIEGTFMAGQSAGMVKSIRPVKDILDALTSNTERLLGNFLDERGIQIG